MIAKRAWALVMAGAGLWLTGVLATGCGGSSVASYCDQMCDCAGCTDDQRAACVDGLDESRDVAGSSGCLEAWDAHIACVNAEAQCSSGALATDGCETESDALYACGASFGFTCGTVCEKLQACGGEDAEQCVSSCTDARDNARAIGCAAEFDAYAMCVGQADDTCGNGQEECANTGNSYILCLTEYCDANPSAPGCAAPGGP